MRGLHAVPGQEGFRFGPVRRFPRQAGVGEGLVQRILEDGLRPVRHRAMPQCGENRKTPAVERRRAFLLLENGSVAFYTRCKPARRGTLRRAARHGEFTRMRHAWRRLRIQRKRSGPSVR
ncbi:hypothetical protein EMIT0111MI5_140038 [Burkholderia sp. IT-111MI5]